MLQKQWEQAFLLVEIKKIPICLIYKVCLLKKYNVKCLLKRNNRRNMEKLCGERKSYWNGGKKGLKFQQGLFQEAQSINNAVMKCNNTVNKYHLTRSVQSLTCLALGDTWVSDPCFSSPASFKALFIVCFPHHVLPHSQPPTWCFCCCVLGFQDPNGNSFCCCLKLFPP